MRAGEQRPDEILDVITGLVPAIPIVSSAAPL
jgi:hypothetical protein